MKYKILLGGSGGESYIHNITPEQNEKLLEFEDLNDGIESEEILEIIEKDYFDDTEESYLGAYNSSDSYYILVTDENGNKIFESNEDFNLNEVYDEDEDYIIVADNPNTLIIEEYVKGNFFNFKIETEEFDVKKLTPIIKDVGSHIQVITGLRYNGEALEKEFDDYWSKGITYYLFD